MPRKTPKKKKAKTNHARSAAAEDEEELSASSTSNMPISDDDTTIPPLLSTTTNNRNSKSTSSQYELSDDSGSDHDINSSSKNNRVNSSSDQNPSTLDIHRNNDDDQEEVPVKKRNGSQANLSSSETEDSKPPEQHSSSKSTSSMELSEDDDVTAADSDTKTKPSRKTSNKKKTSKKKSAAVRSSTSVSNNKRKRSSAQSSDDEEAEDNNSTANRELSDDDNDTESAIIPTAKEVMPKTPTRSQPRSRRGGTSEANTPSVANTPQTPSSATLSRPRKLDVWKKLLVLRPEDLISLNKLRSRISQAVKESKSMSANKSSPKKQDSDISRLSVTVNSLTDADLQLLADEKQRTGTVTLIDSTQATRKYRDFTELEELEDKGADLTNVPVPNFTVTKDNTAKKGFRRTHHYMKYTNTENYDHETLMLNPTPNLHADFDTYSHRKIDISLEYNMESEDEEWLNEYNTGRRNPLSKKDFECIIALMNRACKNGKIPWFSTASVMDLSRFFNVKLQEHDIISVKKLWESRYNTDRKKKEHETRIENEIRLVNLYDLKDKFLKLKSVFKSEQDHASKQKDMTEKQVKQMSKKEFDISTHIPKFSDKFHALRKQDKYELKLETIQQFKAQEEEIYNQVKHLDIPEIEMYNREHGEVHSPASFTDFHQKTIQPQPSTTNGPFQNESESLTSDTIAQTSSSDQQAENIATRRRTRKRKDAASSSTPGGSSNSEETNTPESPPSLVAKPYTFSRLSSKKKKQSPNVDNSPSSPHPPNDDN